MRKAALVCFLILIPCLLRAQETGDWKALYGLRPGEKIELFETGMKKHVGIFTTVTDEAIQLREGSNDIGIRKESVARVTLLEKSHRLRNSLIFGVSLAIFRNDFGLVSFALRRYVGAIVQTPVSYDDEVVPK